MYFISDHLPSSENLRVFLPLILITYTVNLTKTANILNGHKCVWCKPLVWFSFHTVKIPQSERFTVHFWLTDSITNDEISLAVKLWIYTGISGRYLIRNSAGLPATLTWNSFRFTCLSRRILPNNPRPSPSSPHLPDIHDLSLLTQYYIPYAVETASLNGLRIN
jgi:hypothetical protein